MAAHSSVSILKAVRTAFVLAGSTLLLPVLAEAQSHGTMQVSATVVDSRASFQTLDAARTAISQWVSPKTRRQVDVTTLAQVSVALRPASQQSAGAPVESQAAASPPTLVVRVDYINN